MEAETSRRPVDSFVYPQPASVDGMSRVVHNLRITLWIKSLCCALSTTRVSHAVAVSYREKFSAIARPRACRSRGPTMAFRHRTCGDVPPLIRALALAFRLSHNGLAVSSTGSVCGYAEESCSLMNCLSNSLGRACSENCRSTQRAKWERKPDSARTATGRPLHQ